MRVLDAIFLTFYASVLTNEARSIVVRTTSLTQATEQFFRLWKIGGRREREMGKRSKMNHAWCCSAAPMVMHACIRCWATALSPTLFSPTPDIKAVQQHCVIASTAARKTLPALLARQAGPKRRPSEGHRESHRQWPTFQLYKDRCLAVQQSDSDNEMRIV